MRRSIVLGCVLLLCLQSAGAQRTVTLAPASPSPEPRVALVIGNSAYPSSPLANPVNDANDMAQALRLLGFKVLLVRDANSREMRQAIREWAPELRRARVGLFYFAGHGVQIRGSNYLIPVATPLESEADVEDLAIDANYAVRTMEESQVEVSIVILDACRNNPFARNFRSSAAGLAQMTAARGTIIAFSTAPGSVASDGVGRNGTYTRGLLDSLRHQDTDILKVFQRTRATVVRETGGKQMPWESTSLIGEFHFRVEGSTQVAAAVQPAPPVASLPVVSASLDRALDSPLFLEELDAFLAQEKAPVSELQRLAEGGDPLASARWCAIATHERFNMGIAPSAGLPHCKRLADEGLAAGLFFYGRAYMTGRGLERNTDRGLRLLRESAEKGFALAMNNLGAAHMGGVGVPKDPGEAIRWIRRAAEAGNPVAMVNLSIIYVVGEHVQKDELQAVGWMRKAAELKEPKGMTMLGKMYRDGFGVAKDDTQAFLWFQRAAERGSGSAMGEIGVAYANGHGVKRDKEQAAQWYRKALASGDPEAKAMAEKNLRAIGK